MKVIYPNGLGIVIRDETIKDITVGLDQLLIIRLDGTKYGVKVSPEVWNIQMKSEDCQPTPEALKRIQQRKEQSDLDKTESKLKWRKPAALNKEDSTNILNKLPEYERKLDEVEVSLRYSVAEVKVALQTLKTECEKENKKFESQTKVLQEEFRNLEKSFTDIKKSRLGTPECENRYRDGRDRLALRLDLLEDINKINKSLTFQQNQDSAKLHRLPHLKKNKEEEDNNDLEENWEDDE